MSAVAPDAADAADDYLVFTVTQEGALDLVDWETRHVAFSPARVVLVYSYADHRATVWCGSRVSSELRARATSTSPRDLLVAFDPAFQVHEERVFAAGQEPPEFFEQLAITPRQLAEIARAFETKRTEALFEIAQRSLEAKTLLDEEKFARARARSLEIMALAREIGDDFSIEAQQDFLALVDARVQAIQREKDARVEIDALAGKIHDALNAGAFRRARDYRRRILALLEEIHATPSSGIQQILALEDQRFTDHLARDDTIQREYNIKKIVRPLAEELETHVAANRWDAAIDAVELILAAIEESCDFALVDKWTTRAAELRERARALEKTGEVY